MDWQHTAKLPWVDTEFEVWIHDYVRRVKRIGDWSTYFTPGTLVFTDCTHPEQNVLCHEPFVQAWRLIEPPPATAPVHLPPPSAPSSGKGQ